MIRRCDEHPDDNVTGAGRRRRSSQHGGDARTCIVAHRAYQQGGCNSETRFKVPDEVRLASSTYPVETACMKPCAGGFVSGPREIVGISTKLRSIPGSHIAAIEGHLPKCPDRAYYPEGRLAVRWASSYLMELSRKPGTRV